MSKKEDGETFPLKSMHDFLLEIDKEWGKFRRVAIIGILTSAVLLFFLILRFLSVLVRIRKFGFLEEIDEFVFYIFVVFFVIYEVVLLLRQYKFFGKWERRVGLLLHLEETLMKKIEEEQNK
ncbi:MAG: hypothetical protein V1850_02170 [Candidatus Bathyarchaeota archaeon]